MGRTKEELKKDILKELQEKSPIVLSRLFSMARKPKWNIFEQILSELEDEGKIEIKPHRIRPGSREVWLRIRR
uniref:Uncharacterized protein n=1 Tax=viral metagenome TaxID=1070528 RepID=A0A6M3MAX3_9ZZZZ